MLKVTLIATLYLIALSLGMMVGFNWTLIKATLQYWMAWLWWMLNRPQLAIRVWYWTRQARLLREKMAADANRVRIVIPEALENGRAASSSPSRTVE